jgi:hypothetical protein
MWHVHACCWPTCIVWWRKGKLLGPRYVFPARREQDKRKKLIGRKNISFSFNFSRGASGPRKEKSFHGLYIYVGNLHAHKTVTHTWKKKSHQEILFGLRKLITLSLKSMFACFVCLFVCFWTEKITAVPGTYISIKENQSRRGGNRNTYMENPCGEINLFFEKGEIYWCYKRKNN